MPSSDRLAGQLLAVFTYVRLTPLYVVDLQETFDFGLPTLCDECHMKRVVIIRIVSFLIGECHREAVIIIILRAHLQVHHELLNRRDAAQNAASVRQKLLCLRRLARVLQCKNNRMDNARLLLCQRSSPPESKIARFVHIRFFFRYLLIITYRRTGVKTKKLSIREQH